MTSHNILTHFLPNSGRLRGLLARVVSITAALAALLSHPAWCDIIPPNRTAPWQGNVGVPGGIPTRTTIWKNIVTDLGADPTGHVDAAPIINVRNYFLSGRPSRLHASGDVPDRQTDLSGCEK